jgi:Na+-driven multidrug efflux pump
MVLNPTKMLLPEPSRIKTVLKLAAPVMAANLTQTFINQFDTILIGHLPKEFSIAGQAALGYSVLLHWMVGGFVGAISVGTQAMTARRLGEGNREGAGQVLFNSAMLALMAGTVVTVIAAIFTRPLFSLFTSNEQVLALGVPYCRARFIGILAMVGTLSFKAFFDGLGKTHYHLAVAVGMNVVNAGLAYLLVFGGFGIAAMNVLGAGIAATVASFFGLAGMIGFAMHSMYRKDFRIFRYSNFNWKTIGGIARLSVPSGIATVFVMTGFLLFFKWVGMLDEAMNAEPLQSIDIAAGAWFHSLSGLSMNPSVLGSIVNVKAPVNEAATKVIIDILFLTIMACMGLGIATATLVSQNMGMKRPDEAEKYAWTSVKIAACFAGLLGLVAFIWPDACMGIFTQDPEVVEVGRTPLRIIAAGQFAIGFGLVLAQALFGAGASRFVMKVEILLHVGVLVPLSYFLAIPMGLKLNGIFIAVIAYVLLLAASMTLKFKSGTWKNIHI